MPEQSASLSAPDGHRIRVNAFEPTDPDVTLWSLPMAWRSTAGDMRPSPAG